MTRLRDLMARELRLRGVADRTTAAYVSNMRLLVERTGKHPAHLTEEDVKAYLDELRLDPAALARLHTCRPGRHCLHH